MRALAAISAVCGCLLIFGGLSDTAVDPLRVSVLAEPRLLTITVTLRTVTDRYRWLSVYGCSASVGESGASCSGDFERESTFELSGQRRQHLVYWRDMPRGTMLVTAMAFDGGQHLLARGQAVVLRGE